MADSGAGCRRQPDAGVEGSIVVLKLQASIDNTNVAVAVRREGRRVFATIDEQSYELTLHQSGAGKYLLFKDQRVFDCHVERRPGQLYEVSVGTRQFGVTLVDPKRLSGAAAAAGLADGAARILAPMPGKVVRVLVQEGESIEAGAAVAVVEAMKMQNELKSPKAGTVAAVNVEVGATVNGGDVLAIID